MKAFLAIVVFYFVTVNGLDDCKWGPSYWCQSYDTAVKCDKLSHCQNIWKDKETKGDSLSKSNLGNDIECDVCKFVVKEMDSLLKRNATEGEVKNEIEKVCSYLGQYSDECKSLIDEYFDKIWNLIITEGGDPDKICTLLTLCGSKNFISLKSTAGVSNCQTCKYFAKFAIKKLATKDLEENAEEYMKNYCKTLEQFGMECESFIDRYFDDIWKEIMKGSSPKLICKSCTDTVMSTRSVHPMNFITCDTCEYGLKFFIKFISGDSIQNKVIDVTNKLCTRFMPEKDTEKCEQLIDPVAQIIWQYFLSITYNNTKNICHELGYCKHASSTIFAQEIMPHPAANRLKSTNTSCDLCHLFEQKIIKPFVDSNGTEAETKKKLEDFCGLLPNKDKCISYIKEYFPLIWSILKSQVDTGYVCQTIGMCSRNSVQMKKSVSFKAKFIKVDKCEICTLVINTLKSIADSSDSEDAVKDTITKFCKVLPASASNECTELINNYFDIIWDLMKSTLDTENICKEIKMCSSKLNMKLSKDVILKSQPVGMDECSICKIFVNVLGQHMKENSTEKMVRSALESLCNLLQQEKSLCTTLIIDYFDVLWNLIDQGLINDDICTKIGLCKSKTTKTLLYKTKPPKSQNLCDTCKLIVSFVKPYVDSNSTEQEVKSALEQLCNLLPDSYKSECNSLIDQYFDVIWQLLKSEFDNDLICKQLGLCNSTSVHLKTKPQDLCDTCKSIVNFLKPFIDSDSTEQEVKSALETFCNLLPNSSKSECTSVIEQYFPIIWPLVKSEFDNDLICKQLGLCNSTSVHLKSKIMGGAECLECEVVVNYLYKFLNSSTSQEEVEEVLKTACSLLGTASNECSEFVTTYLPMVWPEIVQIFSNSKELCTRLGLCTTNTVLSTGVTSSGPTCFLCELIMKEIDKLLINNSTENEIEEALDKVCSIIPKAYSSECKTFVNKYGSEIVKLIIEGKANKVLCTLIGLCVGTDKVQLNALTSKASTTECVLCEGVITVVKDILSFDPNVFAEFCKLLPSAVSGECTSLIEKYGSALIKVILNEIDPEKLCHVFKLCTT